jgi:Type IV secretion system pilin
MTILKRIINILLVVVSTGAVLFIIIGGFFMATSAGDTEKANRGKTIITYNIIAVAIAMLSYGIMQFVIWLIGVPS